MQKIILFEQLLVDEVQCKEVVKWKINSDFTYHASAFIQNKSQQVHAYNVM